MFEHRPPWPWHKVRLANIDPPSPPKWSAAKVAIEEERQRVQDTPSRHGVCFTDNILEPVDWEAFDRLGAKLGTLAAQRTNDKILSAIDPVKEPMEKQRRDGMNVQFKFEFHDEVRHTLTGYKGKVVSMTHWDTGCSTYGAQAVLDKDGKRPDLSYFDELVLELVEPVAPANVNTLPPTGGPQTGPASQHPT